MVGGWTIRSEPRLVGRSTRRPSVPVRLAAIAGACALLAGCSAHERSARTTTATAPVALQSTADAPQPASLGGVPIPLARPVVVATAPTMVRPTTSLAAAAPAGPVGKSGGGMASWYGDRFHGRSTANGERFDMHSFTAAHRTFPLPSYVRVTNVNNGRSIVVRVNDRGPFHGNRVIDVSRRTADVLGFRGNGVGNVKLDFVARAPKSGSDDRRLLASYQELGRPSSPPGMQVASLGPVSDADLAREAGGENAFAVARAAVSRSATYAVDTAYKVAAVAKSATSSTRDAVSGAVRKIAPAKAPAEADAAIATAYANEPAPIAAPAAITGGGAKRVVGPAEPVLASVTPAPAATPDTGAKVDVTSRIAAGFDDFR